MNPLDLSGKTALVTGGSRGIGQAIALAFLSAGATVITASNDPKPAWYKEQDQCRHLTVDLLDPAAMASFLTEIDKTARIDILVNSAGIHIPKSLFMLTDEDWEKILKINLLAPAKIIRQVAEKMKKAKTGKIVSISSIAGLVSKPTSSAYSASKAGLIGLTRASALELAPFNVLVNALCPGTTDTEMTQSLLTKEQRAKLEGEVALKRLAKPEEIAAFALFLCSDLNTYITGQTIVVDGGTIIQ